MRKKYLYPTVIGSIFAAVILSYSVNVMAVSDNYTVEREFATDRTMIKEILANQKLTLALLNEIKASLQTKR